MPWSCNSHPALPSYTYCFPDLVLTNGDDILIPPATTILPPALCLPQMEHYLIYPITDKDNLNIAFETLILFHLVNSDRMDWV